MNKRFEEAKVAARKVMRASLCQSTPIAAHLAEAAAETAAAKGMEILALGVDSNLSTIRKIQIGECLKNILQARHDATFNGRQVVMYPDNAQYWETETSKASLRLNSHLLHLGDLLDFQEITDLLI